MANEQQMAYCPSCISFREECNPEPEDYSCSCEYYKAAPKAGKFSFELILRGSIKAGSEAAARLLLSEVLEVFNFASGLEYEVQVDADPGTEAGDGK